MSLKSRTICMIESRLTPIQQLGNGKMSLVEWVKVMLPHKLENGVFYNIEGNVMGEFGGFEDESDRIIIDEKLFDQKSVTQAWRNNVIKSVRESILGTAEESAKEETPIVEYDTTKIEKAIARGKKKKAKKLLEEFKEVLTEEAYNEYKEKIKEMK